MGAFEFSQWRYRLESLDRMNEASRTDHQLARVAFHVNALAVQVSMLFAGRGTPAPKMPDEDTFVVRFVEGKPDGPKPKVEVPKTVPEAQERAEGMFSDWLSLADGYNANNGPSQPAP